MKDIIKELEEISARLKKAEEEIKTSHRNEGFLYNGIEVPVVDTEQFSKPWVEQEELKAIRLRKMMKDAHPINNPLEISFKEISGFKNPENFKLTPESSLFENQFEIRLNKETRRRKYYQKLWKKKARAKKEVELENKILKEKLQEKERKIEELTLRMDTIKRNLTQTIMFADNRINHK